MVKEKTPGVSVWMSIRAKRLPATATAGAITVAHRLERAPPASCWRWFGPQTRKSVRPAASKSKTRTLTLEEVKVRLFFLRRTAILPL